MSQRLRLGAAGATPPLWLGIVAAALAVTVTTALVFLLDDLAPVVSLGVVYLVGVLFVSSLWGWALGMATAVASALAFNWFHIPPTHQFTIRNAENWVALVVFLITAVVASTLAEQARTRARDAEHRRQEADLAAEMARLLLRGDRLRESLPAVAQRLAQALGVESVGLELRAMDGDPGQVALPLRDHDRQVGTLLLPAALPDDMLDRVGRRIVPQLEALLAAALERDELLGDVVETAALRRSDVLKTALLRSVSHDLRSPLTAILAAVDALVMRGISEDERRVLTEDVRTEATRLSRLIDNLLDLSRLESKAAEPRREWTSLAEVLTAAAHGLGLADGTFEFSLDRDLPEVRADAAQLERAFANLLENAARYSGGHPVSVRGRAVGDRVYVRIVDRGPGVPPAQRERIFEPFYRTGAGPDHRGSGLGLAIARGFVEVNGGHISVESIRGQGTVFAVELPRDPAPRAAAPDAVVTP